MNGLIVFIADVGFLEVLIWISALIAQLGPTGAKYNVLDGLLVRKSVDYQTDQGIYNDYFFLAENEAIAQVVESRFSRRWAGGLYQSFGWVAYTYYR